MAYATVIPKSARLGGKDELPTDDLTLGDIIPNGNGRFADLRFGSLHKHKEDGKITAVVKMNKVNASEKDRLLLTEKMNFLEMIPPHTNVLGILQIVPPPQGPMIVMEYCEMGRLSDWLKAINDVNQAVKDQMEEFCRQVASGMSHLHDHQVLHRRLGVRNVLLTQVNSSCVAKVTGFGPIKEEQDFYEGSQKGDRIPLRWMAPEQFARLKSEDRLYSKETDVWSYGVLVYEVFTKGDKPYPDLSDAEIKERVGNGHRMDKPDHCPQLIFEEILSSCWSADPTLRPTFEIILTVLEMYLAGEPDAMEFYQQEYG